MGTQALRELERRLESRRDEVDDLIALLREHADPKAGSARELEAVAYAIALASLGDNHLWQDMQLPSRSELSALISRWFPRLAQRNTNNMKWKKFLYKQLCEREQINVCKSPSCGVCTDYAICFGPEEHSAGIS